MLEGEGLAEPIAGTGLFPRAAVQMMRVGEDDRNARPAARERGRLLRTELDYKLKKLTTLFEPTVIVFMGVIVGFVAIALVQAMYGIYNSRLDQQPLMITRLRSARRADEQPASRWSSCS